MRIWQLSGVPALALALFREVGDFSHWQTWVAVGGLFLFALALVLDFFVPEFWKRYMPMPEASKLVYSRLRKSGHAKHFEGWADGSGKLLISMVEQAIVGTSVDVYGKLEPSVFHEKIDKSKAGQFHFIEGGSVLAYNGDTKPIYTDVSLKRWKLRRVIRELVAGVEAAKL